MLRNYFKTALGNLFKNKTYSFINISGLSLGLASAMLIILYMKDEISYDRFQKNAGNIYHIVRKFGLTRNAERSTRKQGQVCLGSERYAFCVSRFALCVPVINKMQES